MSNEPTTVSVAYTKLQNGHGFQAADKTAKWLLVTSHDLQQAIDEVSSQLSEILGGEWTPTEETQEYLHKGMDNAGKNTANVGLPAFSGFAGVMQWTTAKAA